MLKLDKLSKPELSDYDETIGQRNWGLSLIFMKARKHKNTKHFVINFSNRVRRVTANRGNVGGWEQHQTQLVPQDPVRASGPDKSSVRRAFLFGRDESNTVIHSFREV